MGNVPTTNLNAYYATTTPGNTINSGVIDPALQDIVQAINDNFALFSNFINPVSGELLIPDQTIVTRHIRNNAITNPKYAPLSITADKLADGSITLTKLAELVVTAAKIANFTITENKMSDNSVSRRMIQPASVGVTQLDPTLIAPISDAGVQAKFNQIEDRMDTISVTLEEFPRISPETTDDNRILRAFASITASGKRRRLVITDYIEISQPIQLPSYTSFVGSGKNVSRIKLANSFSGTAAVMLATDSEVRVEASGFSIDGNRSNVTIPVDGINFNNAYTGIPDVYHNVTDIMIENISGKAFAIYGRGESMIRGISVRNVTDTGFYIRNLDSWYSDLSAGLCGVRAFDVAGGPHKLSNCKGWGSPHGWLIANDRHSLVACESQETSQTGFTINSDNNNLQIVVDGVGYDEVNNIRYPNTSAIIINANRNYNVINATVCNEIFSLNSPDSLDYAVKCLGFYNTINIGAKQLFTAAVEPTSDFNTNLIKVQGTKRFLVNNSQIFRLKDNNIGVEIGGTTTVSYLRSYHDSATDAGLGIEFTPSNKSVVAKGNSLTLSLASLASASAPNSSFFVDSSDGKLKFKDSAGTVHSFY
jgi:hypothetical protein